MKNYFDFTLTGKKMFPIWILFYVILLLPYAIYYRTIFEEPKAAYPSPLMGIVFLAFIVIAFLIGFYILQLTIEGVKYKEDNLQFHGTFPGFAGKVLMGVILTIVTFTIYMAWFIRDLTRYIVDNSSRKEEKFSFKGEGTKLFIILLLSLYLPMIVLMLIFRKELAATEEAFLPSYLYQILFTLVLVPYIYYVYKWMINVAYKEYQIHWKTNFWDSVRKLAIELLLGMITFGIYMPLAWVKLYQYFAERTFAEKEGKSLKFGYNIEPTEDFLFIWGQILLTAITVGIYFPWAYSKIGRRILGKTYLEEVGS